MKRELPPELSLTGLAQALGVSPATVTRYEREKIITKLGHGRYPISAIADVVKHLQAASRGGAGPDEWQQARTRVMKAKAEEAEAAARRRKGELLETEQVLACEAGIVTAWRNKIWGMPTRIAPRIILCKTPAEAQELLQEALGDEMLDFSQNGFPVVIREAEKHLLRLHATKARKGKGNRANGGASDEACDGPPA